MQKVMYLHEFALRCFLYCIGQVMFNKFLVWFRFKTFQIQVLTKKASSTRSRTKLNWNF